MSKENEYSLAGTTESNISKNVEKIVDENENLDQNPWIGKNKKNDKNSSHVVGPFSKDTKTVIVKKEGDEKNNLKNDEVAIASILSQMYSILPTGDWCICVTLFNESTYCGKLLRQNNTTDPYRVIIVLCDDNGQEIHIDLADVKKIKKCVK